ncbi:TM2 domain-containing protein [Qipengyuania sp. ASV99]|uniref:TM2 domain-containing protein n=1 Tax=Qipengyuania sp. ASV99 TaxID=3399681 RepID=UPI003A4C55CD
MDDYLRKQQAIEANRKSVGLAYLLWFLLGAFGVHRFYAGSTRTGVAQLLLLLSVLGWVVLIPWLLIDLALIPGLIRDHNMKTVELLGLREMEGPVVPARKVETEADRRREAMLEDLRSTGYRKERRDDTHLYR